MVLKGPSYLENYVTNSLSCAICPTEKETEAVSVSAAGSYVHSGLALCCMSGEVDVKLHP